MNENNHRLAIELRHQLHMHPELSNQEFWTKAYLMDFLRQHTKLEVVDRGAWFYAVHRGAPGGKKLGFRADFDALPIHETIDLPYGSTIAGVSHKCGHDGHSAALAAFAMDDPVFAMTVSTKNVRVGERYLQNHNKLLWQVEGADGVKTGYTRAAGRLLVSSATRSGRRLICVTVNAPDDWQDHKTLLEKGFSRYETRRLVRAGQIMGTAQIAGGTAPDVALLAAEDLFYPLTQEERVSVVIPGTGFVYAPVSEGDSAGYAHILLGETPIANIPLVYGGSARQLRGTRPLFEKLKALFVR